MLNVAFAPAPLAVVLNTVITYNGPGSWKHEALWDEYVVILHNPGSQALTVSTAALVDYAGTVLSPAGDPWALEKESKAMEQKYQAAGVAFVRQTAPGAISISAVLAPAASGYYTYAGIGMALTANPAGLVVLPAVLIINHNNKVAMEKEFTRRRLALPLALAPGETQTGSFFFPMVPNPRSLGLHWSDGTASADSTLPLDFLRGLHIKAPDTAEKP